MQEMHFSVHASSDDLTLDATLIAPEHPVAIVQIIHGMQEHKERYLDFMRALAEAGFASVIHDLRGHGASVRDKDELGNMYDKKGAYVVRDVDDVRESALDTLGKDASQLPYFIFAHSMGTLVARNYIQDHDHLLKGLVLSGAPGKNPATQMGLALVSVLKFFKGENAKSDFCLNLLAADNNKNLTGTHPLRWLSKNEKNVKAYEKDPGCGFDFRLNGYKTVLDLMKGAFKTDGWELKNPSLPILFLAGADDPIILGEEGFKGSQDFLRERGYTHVQGKLYPELRHELLQEEEAAAITQEIITFLKECL